jgi:hypothetical protein
MGAAFSAPSDSSLGIRFTAAETVGISPRVGIFLQGRLEIPRETEIPEVLAFVSGDTVVGFAKTRNRPCRGCFSGYVKGSEYRRVKAFGLL